MVYGGSFSRCLQEWISNQGHLSPESNAAIVEVFVGICDANITSQLSTIEDRLYNILPH